MKKSTSARHRLLTGYNDQNKTADGEYLPLRKISGILLLVHAVLSIILQITWSNIPVGSWIRSGIAGYVFSGILMQGICILIPFLIVAFRFDADARLTIGQSTGHGGIVILSVTIGIPAGVVFIGLNNGLIYMLARLGLSLPSSLFSSADIPRTMNTLFVFVLIGALLPGIIEELMFRGLMQGAMERQGGRISAILFPALAFALFHADPLFILAPFLAGLLLGFLRRKTGSIYPAVLAHISMNLTILFINPILPRITSEYLTTMTSNAVLYASLLAAAVASVALIPMIIVISSIFSTQNHPREKLVFFPFDVTFLFALILLAGNIFFLYFNSV